jgi:hypothetical protein
MQRELARRLARPLDDIAVREAADDDVGGRRVTVGIPEGVIAMASSPTRALTLPAVRSRMPSRSRSIPISTICSRM